MSAGNFTTRGQYEGQWYIDKDPYAIYRCLSKAGTGGNAEDETLSRSEMDTKDINENDGWEFDMDLSEEAWDTMLNEFAADFMKRFPSFTRLDRGVRSHSVSANAIMQNDLFYVAVADNDWSFAIVLMEKPNANEGLMAQHYQRYLDGMKECLLTYVESVAYRTGAYTHGYVNRTSH